MKPVYVEGRRELQRAGGAAANLQGEYRLFGLPAGRYYIRVSPQNETSVESFFTNPALSDRLAANAGRASIPREPEGYPTVSLSGCCPRNCHAGACWRRSDP